MEPFLGSLLLVPYNFAPNGWALCNGQLLPISQNTALFSLLGTYYGGDGVSTFALPDLRGRVPISAGQGPGLQSYQLGESGGAETATLQVPQLPPHNHSVNTVSGAATSKSPANQLLATSTGASVAGAPEIYAAPQPTSTLAPNAVSQTGSGQPVDIRTPYLTFNWIIALVGVYPSRN
jgi:microcystin-dependent protein